MSNEPSGAIDHEFDDNERGAEARLNERIDAFPRELKGGDIAIDLVEGRPLYVRRRKGTAIDVFERDDFDLVTYKAHPWLPIQATDPVYECVFLPTKPKKIPSEKKTQTYSYPRGRLARVPVEWLYGSDKRPQFDQKAALLAAMFANAKSLQDGSDTDVDLVEAAFAVARATFDDDVVDEAIDRSPVEKRADPSEDNSDLDDFE